MRGFLWKEANGLLGSIEISPLDMAKVGYMCVKDGMWKGIELIPMLWIRLSTVKHTDTLNNVDKWLNIKKHVHFILLTCFLKTIS